MSERDPLPPAMGERRAIGGYHPQYRVAAGLIIRALRNGALEWIRVTDPEAGRVDDLQIGARDVLDAIPSQVEPLPADVHLQRSHSGRSRSAKSDQSATDRPPHTQRSCSIA